MILSYADEQFGKVVDYLEQSGLRERTLVIVTADHGESLGEHGHFFNHGNSVYEPSVKVPLLLYLPDGRFAGRRTEASVALIDLFPTVLELLQVSSSQPVQGRSLLPLMEGRPRQPVGYYLETIQPEYKQPGGMLRGLLQGRYKYIRTDGLGPTGEIRRELYDLQADPQELQNLVASRSEQTEQMENELLQLATSGTLEAQKAA